MNICLFSQSAIMAKLSLLVFQGRVEGCVPGGGLMRMVHSEVTDIPRNALFPFFLPGPYCMPKQCEELTLSIIFYNREVRRSSRAGYMAY